MFLLKIFNAEFEKLCYLTVVIKHMKVYVLIHTESFGNLAVVHFGIFLSDFSPL